MLFYQQLPSFRTHLCRHFPLPSLMLLIQGHLSLQQRVDLIILNHGLIIMEESKHRGKNIKVFDLIKLQHVATGFQLHALEQEWRNGSYNQAISCHKNKDETDWFAVLKMDDEEAEDSETHDSTGLSYHFQYEDCILLNNVSFKKHLHCTNDFDSQASKNLQVSICENGEGHGNCREDVWRIKPAGGSFDCFWRVGEQFKLQSVAFGKCLCSHNKRLRQSGENQVFVKKNEGSSKEKQGKDDQKVGSDIWRVSELEPFLYTANLSEKKEGKMTEENIQIERLRAMRAELPQKNLQNTNQTQELLKLANQRLVQMETAKEKVSQNQKNNSFFRKICCCCCLSNESSDEYQKL